MNALDHIDPICTGVESRNSSRRSHRFDLGGGPLERRAMLSAGQTASVFGTGQAEDVVASTPPLSPTSTSAVSAPPPVNTAAPLLSPTTGIPAVPVHNSSATNTPGVSPLVPAPLDTAADESASVITAPSSHITALIPNPGNLSFTMFLGAPVYIVPRPTSSIMELAIESPEPGQPSSPFTAQMITSPVDFHAINVNPPIEPAVSPSAAGSPEPTFTPMNNVGQSLQTELDKPVKPQLGPEPAQEPVVDIVGPPKPSAPAEQEKAGQPATGTPKVPQPNREQPRTDRPSDEMKSPQGLPSVLDMLPMWWLPIAHAPAPFPFVVEHGCAPQDSTDSSAAPIPRVLAEQPIPALVGAAAAVSGIPLAMRESRRFAIAWLPDRAASNQSARPRVPGR